MKRTEVALNKQEIKQIESCAPSSRKSSAAAGKRAYNIVVTYYKRKNAEVVPSPKGVDLSLKFPKSNGIKHYEIKGTEGNDLAFEKLKVSGKPSHRQLTKNNVPLVRVLNVYSNNPVLIEMIHGKDFTLVPEPRWRVKRVALTTRSTRTRQKRRAG